PAAARDRLQPLLDRPGQQEALVTYLLPYLAWAELDLGEEARAEALLDQCLARATDEHIRLAQIDALRVRVLHQTHRGRFDAAEQTLEASLRLGEEMHYPYATAKLLYAGALLAQTRHTLEQASERLQLAQTTLQGLGEGLYRPHVSRALAGLGRTQ